MAFDAVRKCAADFDWDAVVGNMVYVWTGLTQAIGLEYYATPGIDVGADIGFQYREPPEGEAFMKSNEYGALIEDPTGFLYNVWLPRVCTDVVTPGGPATYRNNLSFVKGGMAMMRYFDAFGTQARRLREESGTVSAIAGILKAPLDILADKLRGYVGLAYDLIERPREVQAACEALAPHLLHVARSSADPTRTVPVGFWMHRSCVPFISPAQFEQLNWATLKPIVLELWASGHQTLFYAEGNWDHHLDSFAELPDGSIIYHVDQGDIAEAHRKLGHKFCLSGGIQNALLCFGTPQEVRARCKQVIEDVARDGGYILDASAIVQNVARVENMRAMTEAGREYGVYSSGTSSISGTETAPAAAAPPSGIDDDSWARSRIPPGACVPWEKKRGELPPINGDEALLRNIWEEIDALGNMYIWHCLVSF